ncbi:glucokinase [Thalassotalea litorea]|uniref:Glucokinase n=1 Tax=Thalassotalea litorea TaxID=2020715 RepID=A0A5R9IQ98_9GAMM|nr:glucokinase [Thalassotalea litorea]TLU66217.1 glucokinase [Thalassotalea litorea]
MASNSSMVNIVADIGGTNLRIGMLDGTGSVKNLHLYQCAEFSGLQTVLEDYFVQHQIDSSQVNACLAIACPVDKDLISMTNLPWEFKQSELKANLNLRSLYMINDYTAIAMSINSLDDSQKVKIGGGQAVAHKPIAICGPGTGLGVANLFEYQGQWISVGGEGGHVDFAPTDDTEVAILKFLNNKYPRVSAEQLLSGLGIEQIYQALCDLNQIPAKPYQAKDISAKGVAQQCDICHQAMQQFCKTLGSFAGNLALTTGAFGGVYIAGGIAPRFLEFLAKSDFRKRFEAKGRFEGFNQAIPTYVITEPQPGILGASAFLTQQINNEVVCL